MTEPEQVSRWFADEVDPEPEASYQGSLTFGRSANKAPFTVEVTVRAVDPERSYSYRWQQAPGVARTDRREQEQAASVAQRREGREVRHTVSPERLEGAARAMAAAAARWDARLNAIRRIAEAARRADEPQR